jgi:transcriptional regulator with XRE-family HTH domain
MDRSPKTKMQQEMGWQLRLIREAKSLTQEAMGAHMGVSATAITNYESGTRQIDLVGLAWAAHDLDFPVDFVILGKLGNVPMDLAAKIQELQRRYALHPPTRRGPAPGASKRPTAPTVDEVHEIGLRPRTATLHEAADRFIPPPRSHRT